MNKPEFLWKLRDALSGTFTRTETEDILLDYKDFFVSGNNEGKNKQQICEELGDPFAIALDLAQTLQKKRRLLSTKAFRRVFFTVVLIVIGFMFYYWVNQIVVNIVSGIVLFVSFVVVLWFALGGTLRELPPVSCASRKSRKWIVSAFHVYLIASGIAGWLFIRQLLGFCSAGELDSAILVIDRLRIVLGIALTLAAFAVYGFFRFTPQYFTLVIHALGVVVYLTTALHILARTADPATYINAAALSMIMIIYVFSVFLTAIFEWLIYTINNIQFTECSKGA